MRPAPMVGAEASEIRVGDASGAFRLIYVAKFEAANYVHHAFQKKTQKVLNQTSI
jgi:phage-related protein